jgi:hypothetical protein
MRRRVDGCPILNFAFFAKFRVGTFRDEVELPRLLIARSAQGMEGDYRLGGSCAVTDDYPALRKEPKRADALKDKLGLKGPAGSPPVSLHFIE